MKFSILPCLQKGDKVAILSPSAEIALCFPVGLRAWVEKASGSVSSSAGRNFLQHVKVLTT